MAVHALLLGEFGAQKRSEEHLIQLDHAVQDALAIDRPIVAQAIEVRVERTV